MNRNMFRGVIAAAAVTGMVGALAGVNAWADESSARAATSAQVAPDFTINRPGAVDWQVGGHKDWVPPKPKPKPRPAATHVSRAQTRAPLSALSPREIGRALAAQHGWTGEQFTCLDNLWTKESGWQVHDENSSSGAYGIPQALPASKMATFGSDYRSNAVTQIKWGLWYIGDRYGTPCAAWQHSVDYNYY